MCGIVFDMHVCFWYNVIGYATMPASELLTHHHLRDGKKETGGGVEEQATVLLCPHQPASFLREVGNHVKEWQREGGAAYELSEGRVRGMRSDRQCF